MKSKTNKIVRILVVLTLYVCCSSVVCCEADKASVINEPTSNDCRACNKQTVEDDMNPAELVSIHIMQLL